MKSFSILLSGAGVLLFFFSFLFWMLEDYQGEQASMWPIFLGLALVGAGIVLFIKSNSREG